MRIFPRILIVAFVIAVPVVIVAALYVLTLFVLKATQRTIDPQIVQMASAAEYIAFLFLALIEARNRW